MNFNRLLVFCLGFVLWSNSCGASFPRGKAWGEEKKCERALAGRVETVISSGTTGEILSLVITDIEFVAVEARKLEMRPSRETKPPAYMELKLEPGSMKAAAVENIMDKSFIFFFMDRRCGKYDQIQKVFGRYRDGTKEITGQLLREKKTAERR